MTNRDLLRSIHANNLAALEWQHASLRDIQSETRLFDLWDSIFVFQPLKSIYSSPLWSMLNADEFQANVQVRAFHFLRSSTNWATLVSIELRVSRNG